MRILHVIPTIDPRSGGPAEGLRQFCELYIQFGHEVEVATMDAPETLRGLDFPVPVTALGPGIGVYGFSWQAYPWLRDNVQRFDAVILNTVWQYSTVAGYLALLGRKIPYAVFTHGMMDPWFRYRYPLKHLKKCVYWAVILQRILRSARTVFFTAEEEKVLARQSFWGYRVHETVVPYGSFGPTWNLAEARTHFLEAWPELQGKRLLISLGRIHPKKGVDLLLEAFAKTAAQNEDFQLVIAGPDQVGWKKELEQQAERLGVASRITWTGMLVGEMKWGALAASEAFVLPSHQENFGIVVAEALSCGLPVLISDKINIWREVVKQWAGLVESDTLEGTISSLQRWMELSSEEILDLRMRSRRCFDRYFNLHFTAEKLVDSVVNLTDKKDQALCAR